MTAFKTTSTYIDISYRLYILTMNQYGNNFLTNNFLSSIELCQLSKRQLHIKTSHNNFTFSITDASIKATSRYFCYYNTIHNNNIIKQ